MRRLASACVEPLAAASRGSTSRDDSTELVEVCEGAVWPDFANRLVVPTPREPLPDGRGSFGSAPRDPLSHGRLAIGFDEPRRLD
jgi:hypothetical protein